MKIAVLLRLTSLQFGSRCQDQFTIKILFTTYDTCTVIIKFLKTLDITIYINLRDIHWNQQFLLYVIRESCTHICMCINKFQKVRACTYCFNNTKKSNVYKIHLRGGVGQWVACLTRNVEVGVQAPSKALVVSLSKKLYPYFLVLVGFRNAFKRDFTIKLK